MLRIFTANSQIINKNSRPETEGRIDELICGQCLKDSAPNYFNILLQIQCFS